MQKVLFLVCVASKKSSRFDIKAPALGAQLFNPRIVGRSVQNIIVAKIERYVSDPLDARIILTFLVREENAIPALEIAFRHVLALLHLRACVYVEKLPRSLIKDILNEGGAIEFLRGKAR